MSFICKSSNSVVSFAQILYLFTKSDIKTSVVPITVLAAAASLRDVSRLPHVVFWVWMHVLQIDIANQILDPEEDKLNKAHRPLASDKISLYNAWILRWLSVPACLLLSACYSAETVYASLAIAILTVVYDELGGHRDWMKRSTLLPVGYAFFEIGACLVASSNPHKLGNVALTSVLMSAGAYGTTHQATDFKDIEGDRVLGRNTIPIAAPVLARPTLMLLMCAWSLWSCSIWELGMLTSLALNVLGFFVGVRFLLRRTVEEDKRSCFLYNVWLSSIHVLPVYWRLFAATAVI